MAKNYEMDMTDGPLLKKMVIFSVPLVLSGALQLLFNTVDTIVVGKFVGDNALAAVGSTGSLVNLIIGVFMGLSVGTNVLIAQAYGAKRTEDAELVVSTSVIISIVFGLILGAFGAVFAKLFLSWMGTPEEVLDQAAVYLRIYFMGMPFNMLYNFTSAVLRGIGDTRRPLYFLLIAGIVNLVLNLFCVIVLHIGVAGVAIATVISQAVSCVLVMVCLVRNKGAVRLNPKNMKMDWKIFGRILQIGLPAGFQSIMFSISNVMIQSSINSFGAYAMAGNTAACNLESFVGNVNSSMHQANINFTSQNMGAKKYNRVWKVLGLSQLLCVIIDLALSQLLLQGGQIFLRLYTDSPEVIEYGMIRLRMVCALQMIGGMMDVMVGSLRGIGSSITPMIVSLTGVCLFRIVYLETYFKAHRTLEVLYASYPITWTITALMHFICFVILFRKVRKGHAERSRIRKMAE